jgi:hypothetical protein
MMLHIVVVKPSPIARARIEMMARPGCLVSIRKPCFRSEKKEPILSLRSFSGIRPAYGASADKVSHRNP